MFSTLRTRFGIPGVISVIALVFAMFGGAYAASNHGGGKATASAKAKKGPRGPKGATGVAGPAGAAGAVGPAGPQGPKGDAGEPGEPGKNGKEGKEGKEGSPWTDGGTLPSESTETGAWSTGKLFATGERIITPIPISFAIPLALPPGFQGDPLLDEEHVFYVTQEQVENHKATSHCPGTVTHPLAEQGYLCAYQGGTEFPETGHVTLLTFSPPSTVASQITGAGSAGAIAWVSYTGPAGEVELMGSWAVTAP